MTCLTKLSCTRYAASVSKLLGWLLESSKNAKTCYEDGISVIHGLPAALETVTASLLVWQVERQQALAALPYNASSNDRAEQGGSLTNAVHSVERVLVCLIEPSKLTSWPGAPSHPLLRFLGLSALDSRNGGQGRFFRRGAHITSERSGLIWAFRAAALWKAQRLDRNHDSPSLNPTANAEPVNYSLLNLAAQALAATEHDHPRPDDEVQQEKEAILALVAPHQTSPFGILHHSTYCIRGQAMQAGDVSAPVGHFTTDGFLKITAPGKLTTTRSISICTISTAYNQVLAMVWQEIRRFCGSSLVDKAIGVISASLARSCTERGDYTAIGSSLLDALELSAATQLEWNTAVDDRYRGPGVKLYVMSNGSLTMTSDGAARVLSNHQRITELLVVFFQLSGALSVRGPQMMDFICETTSEVTRNMFYFRGMLCSRHQSTKRRGQAVDRCYTSSASLVAALVVGLINPFTE